MRAIVLMMLLAALPVQADVYKWTDDSGHVVYSDSPPPPGKGKGQQVKIKEQPVTAVAPPARKSDASAPKPASAVASAPAQPAKPPRDEAACAAAAKRLSFLQGANMYKQVGKDGIEYLDADKKKKEIAEKQDFISKNCQ